MRPMKAPSRPARNQKDSLAIIWLAVNVPLHPTMKLSALICLTLLIVNAVAGCALFGKTAKPKANSAIAAETEEGFMQRWVSRRSAELVAQGLSAEDARAQAASEFRERYRYMSAAQK